MKRLILICAAMAASVPASARDSLGIWNDWGAFRDMGIPRCYAIAMAVPVAGKRIDFQGYLTIGTWPRRSTRNEVHVRLSRRLAADAQAVLNVGGQRFPLVAGQADVWPADPRASAAIVAAMRSAQEMTVMARGADGRTFRDSYRLAGAASAMDAAALGCAHA